MLKKCEIYLLSLQLVLRTLALTIKIWLPRQPSHDKRWQMNWIRWRSAATWSTIYSEIESLFLFILLMKLFCEINEDKYPKFFIFHTADAMKLDEELWISSRVNFTPDSINFSATKPAAVSFSSPTKLWNLIQLERNFWVLDLASLQSFIKFAAIHWLKLDTMAMNSRQLFISSVSSVECKVNMRRFPRQHTRPE